MKKLFCLSIASLLLSFTALANGINTSSNTSEMNPGTKKVQTKETTVIESSSKPASQDYGVMEDTTSSTTTKETTEEIEAQEDTMDVDTMDSDVE